MTMQAAESRLTPADAIAKYGLIVEAEFIPWSKSRSFKPNAKAFEQNLNWRVTLKKDGRPILTTDYSAGCAHCPSYSQGHRTLEAAEIIRYECEHGVTAPKQSWMRSASRPPSGAAKITPSVTDVVHSLLSDGDALDYSTFEDWASSFGYEPDSRKAETIYRQCLEIGLKLRNGLGETALAELRESFQDY